MATEVLRPQNCMVDQMRGSPAVFQRRRDAKSSRRQPVRPNQRRRFGSAVTACGMVTEKVAILRRGELLNSRGYPSRHDREMIGQKPQEIAGDVYAGPATFVGSPAPSSLPLPSFSRKMKNQVVLVDGIATRDLRRLLRLES